MVAVLIVVLVLLGLLIVGIYWRNARHAAARRAIDLGLVSAAAEDDIKEFAHELAELRDAPAIGMLSAGTQREYDSARESLDAAATLLAKASGPAEIRRVTECLERGRYSVMCVRARLSGKQLPARRPPCFFNPQHGPSAGDVDWAPPGSQPRPLPACADDALHVAVGAPPDIRTVLVGTGTLSVEYWRAGSAFAGYVTGYFGAYAAGGALPGLLTAVMDGANGDPSVSPGTARGNG
ncbi:hypothetical protein GCM10027344_03780 [Spelaeicoccus albus]|uniref:Uncharacterized protein n=1 Tax=Spelaeicoccus albus TaxID=1280376 RepID=A0A7Z0D1B0_9MICO|nr:hypothetical protein [Spelaeicoccus albus]